jgi:hypothetical protein
VPQGVECVASLRAPHDFIVEDADKGRRIAGADGLIITSFKNFIDLF